MFKVNNKNTRTMSMMYIYDVYMTYTTSRFIQRYGCIRYVPFKSCFQ